MDIKLFFAVLCLIVPVIMASEIKRIVSGNEQFGKSLYSQLPKEGNIISSPFSAHMVLTMAYQGAAGETEKAFQKVLGLESADSAADEYQELMTAITKVTSVTFKTANKIFLKESYGLKAPFKATIEKKFLADAEELNFADNVKAASTINQWVEGKTNNKIKDLISSDSLNSDTRLVLVNAIYFKGSWAKKFNKDLTQEAPFYLADGSEVKCDMMHINGKYKYSENDNLKAKILEMPYEGKKLSMVIMLPNERDGITHLESELHNFDFSTLGQNMNTWEVDVALPRFKIESNIPLKDELKKMGLEVMFSNSANFSKIAEKGENLKVSDVIQKAFIEVNEEGAEAAAATGITFTKYSMPKPKQHSSFLADHSFMVALVHKKTGNKSIIFLGRIADPTK